MSPEQLVRDRSEYARKGIARGRSVIALVYDGGIAFVAENPSSTLHKISELYDRIAFAAVGKYNEFEILRVAGVRLADMRGYSYDRRDVTGRGLANAYAQTLGSIFIENQKPYEVEIVVAELGATPAEDQLYRLTYDGSVADEAGFVAMGGQSEAISTLLRERHTGDMALADAIALALDGLSAGMGSGPAAAARPLGLSTLEVAVLERARPRRAFRRITGAALAALLPATATADAPAPHSDGAGEAPDVAADVAADAPPDGGSES
jgi:proteasome alpha subunit